MANPPLNNQIAITKIENEEIKKAVFEALELIDAKQLFTRAGLTVLLKPNILIAKPPERAATTHPSIVRAVIQWVNQFSPKKIVVAESSGGQAMGTTEKGFKACGIQDVCEEEGVEWTSFEKTPRKVAHVVNPLVLKEFPISTLFDEADIVINLPKIKTHKQCIMTCAIKNMFGTLVLAHKPKTHAQFPKLEDFHASLADIYSVSKPHLTVIDGYLCQEGDGPSAGDVVKLDIVLAGYDPVALDTTVCSIIGVDPKRVMYLDKAESKGLGTKNLAQIVYKGVSVDQIRRPFKPPKNMAFSLPIPKFMAEYVGKTVFRTQIHFDIANCKLCATCWKNCPVVAIDPPLKLKIGETVPVWNAKKCITCYCCAELCPHEAIDFKLNIVQNVLRSWLILIPIGALIGVIALIWYIFFFM